MAKFTYTYELIGVMSNGGNSIEEITASCQDEAKAILESFHDGEYELLWTDDNDEIYDEELPDYEWIAMNEERRRLESYPDYFYEKFKDDLKEIFEDGYEYKNPIGHSL